MSSRTVLVIEDNPQNRYLVRFILEKQGYEVVEATTGPEGLEIVRELKPSLILLDIQLPGMDGYEVARQLRLHPHSAHIAIVAVTSYAMVGDREKILAAGCDGYIEKPIDPETFVDQIAEFLEASCG